MSRNENINQAKPREEYQTDMEEYECKQCGYIYDTSEQDAPPDASFYWVPKCPYCHSKMTSTVIDEIHLEAANDTLSIMKGDINEEEWIDRMQAWARHLHGKEVHEYAD